MLYSPLYRSFMQAHRGAWQRPRTVIVASLPLLFGVGPVYASSPLTVPKGYQTPNAAILNEQSDTTTDEVSQAKSLDHSIPSLNYDNDIAVPPPSAQNTLVNTAEIPEDAVKTTQTPVLSDTFKTSKATQSLARLSQFYKPLNSADDSEENERALAHSTSHHPAEATLTTADSANLSTTHLHHGDWIHTPTQAVNPKESAPIAAPDIYNRNDASAYRCEGVWVSPSEVDNSTYKQAIRRAATHDNLDISNGLPIYAQADYGYYDSISQVELSGNVEVVSNGELISAEQLTLDLESGVVGASGDVLLAESVANPTNQDKGDNPTALNDRSGGLIAVADNIAYDTNSSTATASDVAFASVSMQAHGYAKRLNKPDDTHYELEKVMFSTCPPTNRKWQLEAEQIDIDTETGRGESYNTTFRLGKVPILYLPYFNFPIDDRRSSGLLTPSASIDSDSGLRISVPYYLNLAPNFDSTLTTDIYSNRNPMLTGEFRYLAGEYGAGELKGGYLPNDKEYNDKDRQGFYYKHEWESDTIKNLSASAVYNYVSDPEYITDFEDFGVTSNSLNLPRRAQVNYINDYIDGQLKVETFQSLKATDSEGNLVQDKDKPYSRLPQLSVEYRLPNSSHFEVTGVHDSAYFKKSINDGSENEKSGVRIYNEIGTSYPMSATWGYVIPKISLQHLFTAYDEESRLDNNVSEIDSSQSVFVPKVSIDSGLNFYQSGTPFGLFEQKLGGYQLLSPRLKYTYSKYKDHSKIPNFNTRIASVDYDQLFSDSRFLGYDRIADNNNIAAGLNYRYIDAMGVTRFNGSIGNQFYLEDPQVSLDESSLLREQNSSGVAWNSSLQPYRNVWFDFNGALNDDNHLNFLNSQIRYRPTPLSLVNLGFIKRKYDPNRNQAALSAITASAIFPINRSWRVMAQGQYDNRSHKFIDSTFGLNYEDCCYGFSIYGRSYYNDLNLDSDPTNAVMAEFRINGLGNKRSKLSELLIDKAPGVEPVDVLWNK